MGSNETAAATTGGHRVIDVLTRDGAPSGPNYLLFLDADRPSDSYGVALIVGSHLHRMRWRLGLSRELWIQNIEDLGSSWLAG